jgi:hypothetical protein
LHIGGAATHDKKAALPEIFRGRRLLAVVFG